MNTRKIAKGSLALGIGLLLLSLAWPYVLPESTAWSDAQATELNNASEALHDAMHAHGKGHNHGAFGEIHADDDPAVVAGANRYRELREKLDKAKFWTQTFAAYLRWSGLTMCVVGLVAFFSSR